MTAGATGSTRTRRCAAPCPLSTTALVTHTGRMTLNASVENLTDEDPPLARLDLSYDPFTASNAYGRTYKVGLRKRFGQ